MVHLRSTCSANMIDDFVENQSEIIEKDIWREVIQMGKDGKSKLKASTKNRLLAEYEVKAGKTGGKRQLSRIPLWYFLHEILNVEHCQKLISWENRTNLTFSIKKPNELALLWGAVKNSNATMTYAKLARGIRYYYGKGVIEKIREKKFCYQFIRSKKTKLVLSKQQNIEVEKLTDKEVTKNLLDCNKQTSTVSRQDQNFSSISSTIDSNSIDSTSIDTNSIDSNESKHFSGDENNSEFCLQNWKLYDSYIADIFNDTDRMKDIFNDIQFAFDNLNKADDNTLNTHDSTLTTREQLCSDDIPSDLRNFCADISKLFKEETDDSLDNLSQSQIFKPSCLYSTMNSKEKCSRKRSRSETSDPFLSPFKNNRMFTDNKLLMPPSDNVKSNKKLISTLTTPFALHSSRSLPDFSLLKGLLDNFDQDVFEKDCKVEH